MSSEKQVFQTSKKYRWRTFQWTGRFIIFLVALMIPVVIITLRRGVKPDLPSLSESVNSKQHNIHPAIPAGLNGTDLKKYKGFDAFLKEREKNELLKKAEIGKTPSNEIRAAFYVDWDPQSFFSLQKNISKLNMVVPEWLFIDAATDTLRPDVDTAALALMKRNHVRILPLINNINERLGEGEFDGDILHRILNSPLKRKRLVDDIVSFIQKYQLQGINIDFEEYKEKSDEPIIQFHRELYERLHPLGLLVTQDIAPNNEDFNVKQLSNYNDYLFLMAYDEHYGTSVPGAISSQQWIESVLDQATKNIHPEKIVVCLAGYGYDWPRNAEATTVTYQQALSNAKIGKATIEFDNDTYNNHYQYTDLAGIPHQVYFADAATNFNTMRFADEYGVAGTALWRLGSEDERLWSFYSRSLSNKSIQQQPFNFDELKVVRTPAESPDYIGDGEILNVVTEPSPGKIELEIAPEEGLISEQRYLQLPTKYVIKKYGNVHQQVILTFDDGPDPQYTPQVLKILKQEHVPATFFVVGLQAENNLPLLQQLSSEGFEIGNHTFTHPNIATVSKERAATELESTRLLIEAVTGRSTILFRAPYNADAEPTTEAELKPIALSKEKNYYTVGESIDPNDWEKGVTADTIYERTIRQYEANPSKGIILLHDAGGDRQATVDALPRIIHYFKSKHIGFTTVASLLGKTNNEVMPPVHNRLVKLNGKIALFWYWFEAFITAAFWVAIVLGFARIAIMAVMAMIQKVKADRMNPMYNIPLVNPPAVSIIVPAYNEEVNAVKTVQSLLQQDYTNFEIIFVDDGSADQTYQLVLHAFAGNAKVKVLTKKNGGKASALNFGISHTANAYVVCIDADTQLKKDAITQLMKRFAITLQGRDEIGAVAGNVKVGNENSILTKWQSIEYITAQNFDRRAFGLINCITVVPGAIGAFKKQAIEKAGGFTTDTLAEDCDLTIRILRNGYRVLNCTEAIAVTEAPETLKPFMKQRFRWSYGIMQSFWKNRDVCFNPKYKALGMVAFPNILLFQILLPMIAPLADIMLLVSLAWNWNNPASLHKITDYYLLFFAVDILVSCIAFLFEREKLSKLIWLIPQRFAYRQLMYIILFKAIKKAIKGESQGWGVLKRTGNVRQYEDDATKQ